MKRIIIMALTLVVSASFISASAGPKDKKAKKTAAALKTPIDTLSYAAGLNATFGFDTFLKNQFKNDEAKIAAFYRGFNEALSKADSDEMIAYSLGLSFPQRLKENNFKLIDEELTEQLDYHLFLNGFEAGMKNDTLRMGRQQADKRIQESRKAAENQRKESAKAFMEQNKTKEGVQVTASGLQYKVIRKGEGAIAKPTDEVEVKYEGRLPDGTVFDSSDKQPNKSATFQPGKLIKGGSEALTMMPEGSLWELYIPYELAYGSRKAGPIPPYSPLVFTLEVLKVSPQKAPENNIQYSPVLPGELKPMKVAPKKQR